MKERVMVKKPKQSKYNAPQLLLMLRKAASLRNDMLAAGFTDNGGAIHSAERILDILGTRLRYPKLTHATKLKDYLGAEFSPAAFRARQQGKKVLIEHVYPRRAFTRDIIKALGSRKSDREILHFIKRNYRLVLLTADETTRLNKMNRTNMSPRRLRDAGIKKTMRLAIPAR